MQRYLDVFNVIYVKIRRSIIFFCCWGYLFCAAVGGSPLPQKSGDARCCVSAVCVSYALRRVGFI